MKLRYLALSVAMAFSAPAFAAPSSDPSTVPAFGTWIDQEVFIKPAKNGIASNEHTYTLGDGWYTFGIAATALGANFNFGSFTAQLINSSGATIQELTLLTDKLSPTLFDAVNNFHLDAGTYKISILGYSTGSSSGAAAAIYNGVAPVPGPEAGAGLGALALGGVALYLQRRRKDESATA